MSHRVRLVWGAGSLDLNRRRIIFGRASGDAAREFLPDELFSLVTDFDGSVVITPLHQGWPDVCVNSVPIEDSVRLREGDVLSWGPGPKPDSESWVRARLEGLVGDLVPLGCMGVDGRPVSVPEAEPHAVLVEAFELERPHAVFEIAQRWYDRVVRSVAEWWLARNVNEANAVLSAPGRESLELLAKRLLAEAAHDPKWLERADATAALLQIEVSNQTTVVGLEASVTSRERALEQLQHVLEATRAVLSVLDPRLVQKEALAQLADVLVKEDLEVERKDHLAERIAEHEGTGVLDGDVVLSERNGRLAQSDLRVVRGRLIIEHCPNLVHIDLPNLEAAQEILIRHNPWLTRLSLPKLELVINRLDITNNELLRHIDLPVLGDVGELTIEHNFSLGEQEVERLQQNPVARWSRLSPGPNPEEPLQVLITQARLDPEFRANLIETLDHELEGELEWAQLLFFDALAKDDVGRSVAAARRLGQLGLDSTRRFMDALVEALQRSPGLTLPALTGPTEGVFEAGVMRELEDKLGTLPAEARPHVAHRLLARLFGDYLPRVLETRRRWCLARLFACAVPLDADLELLVVRYADAASDVPEVRGWTALVKEPLVSLARGVSDAARSVHESLAHRECALLIQDLEDAAKGRLTATLGTLAHSWSRHRELAQREEEEKAAEAINAVLMGFESAAARIRAVHGESALQDMRAVLKTACLRRKWSALSTSRWCEVGLVNWVCVAVPSPILRFEHFGWREGKAERLENPFIALVRGRSLSPADVASVYAQVRGVLVAEGLEQIADWAERHRLLDAPRLWRPPWADSAGVHWFSCESNGLVAHQLDPDFNHQRQVAVELRTRSLFY